MLRSSYQGWSALFLLAVAGGLLPGCREADPGPVEAGEPPESPWFAEVGAARGLDFVHDAGAPSDRYFLPQVMGSGVALFDFDGDGLLDLYLVQNAGPHAR